MKSASVVFAGATLLSLASASGTLQLGITGKRETSNSQQLRRRASTSGTVTAPLSENKFFIQYYANVTIGTPPQNVQLVVDTGSSDVWAVAANAAICKTAPGCEQGTFDHSKSSTFDDNGPGEFQDSYADGTGTTGDFFKDNFGIGGANVEAFQMGLATNTSIAKGIMGVAFDTMEAGGQFQYPNLVDSMVNQSIITTQAYSLWLDDREAGTGSLLFGGIDTGKFTGPLFNIAMYPSADTGNIDRFTVAFTSLSITSPSGTETITPPGYGEAVILDSGTTMTYVPDDLAQAIYNVVGADYQSSVQIAVVRCSIGNVAGTLDFQFAGAYGPVIKVPLSELVYPLFRDDGTQETFKDGQPACIFGIEPASSLGSNAALLFGDTVLRSAYVVYDLANYRIGLAPTDFNSTKSNVVAFPGLGANIPSATTVANEAAVTQTASKGNVGGAGGAGATAASSNVAAVTSGAMFTGAAGPAFSSAYTQTAASSTGTGKKSAAGVGPKPFAWELVTLIGGVISLMLMGGGVFMM